MIRANCILPILACSLACIAAEPAPFVVSKDGVAAAAVVIDKTAGPGVRHAATELVDYLGKITGGRFAISNVPVPGYNTILVGEPYKAVNRDEIRVRVKDPKTLEVTGDGADGTLFAVYDLLETLGCGFYTHDYEVVPTNADLVVAGNLDKTDAPYMTWRGMWSYLGRHDFDYCMKLRFNDRGTGNARKREEYGIVGYKGDFGQTLTTFYVSSRKFHKTHPEWFAWNRQKQKYEQTGVCVSNEEMYQELFKEVSEYLEKNYTNGVREVSIGATDSPAYCECEKCLAISRADTNPECTEVPAAQHVVLINRVARHFAKQYPDVRFNFLAYDARGPADSEKFKLEPNAGVALAYLWRNFRGPMESCDRAPYCVERWAKLSDRNGMYNWDYYANFSNYQFPFPDYDNMGPNFRYYKRLGMKGVNPQMQWCLTGDLAELHYWLLGKLAWNPDADDQKLIDEFVTNVYGAAAPFMRQYIELNIRAKHRNPAIHIGCYVKDTFHFLTPNDCIDILRLFDKARVALRNDPARLRQVDRAYMGILSMALVRYCDLMQTAKEQRYGLRPPQQLLNEYKRIENANVGAEIGENPGYNWQWWEDNCVKQLLTNTPAATVWPEKTAPSIRIAAKDMTGGTRMTKERAADGFEFARIKVALTGEVESVWMNPGFAEIGYTVPAEQAGEWYVFATVRVGATVPRDHAAAYLGIYSPFWSNGRKVLDCMEIAQLPVAASVGDDAWQTVCLGRFLLYPGARIWLMPGVNNATRYQDVKNFILIDPAVMEGALSVKGK